MINHLLGHFFVRTPHNIFFYLLKIYLLSNVGANLFGVANYFYSFAGKEFFCDCPSGNPTYGFTRTGAPATTIITKPIFHQISKVRVARSKHILNFFIFRRISILIFNPQRDGSSCCFTLEDTGKNMYEISFFSGCGYFTLTCLSSVKFLLDVGFF